MIAAAHHGETLDGLCWRVLGRTEGVTEQALAMNAGLAANGPILSEGQTIILPEISAAAVAIRQSINLWDA